MENRYLTRLGLEPGATRADVRRAYRRLSKQYHPDRNDDPHAPARFIDIHEAYKFLTTVGPAPHQEEVSYGYDPEGTEFERNRQKARQYAYWRHQEAEKRRLAAVRHLLYWFNFVAVAIVLFNTLLALDYYLPRQLHQEVIVRVSRGYESAGRSGRSVYRYDDIEFQRFRMRLDKGEVISLDHYERAVVEATLLLNTPLRLLLTVDGVTTEHLQIYGLYRIFIYLIPAMFVVAGVYGGVLKSADDKIGFAVLMLMMAAIQLVLFFTR